MNNGNFRVTAVRIDSEYGVEDYKITLQKIDEKGKVISGREPLILKFYSLEDALVYQLGKTFTIKSEEVKQ